MQGRQCPRNPSGCPSVSRSVKGKRFLALSPVFLAAAVVATGCGSGANSADSSGTTTPPSTAATTAPTTATTVAATTTTAAGQPAGGACWGFDPSRLPPCRPASTGFSVTRSATTRFAPRSCGRPMVGPIRRFAGAGRPACYCVGRGADYGRYKHVAFCRHLGRFRFFDGPDGAFFDTHDGGERWHRLGSSRVVSCLLLALERAMPSLSRYLPKRRMFVSRAGAFAGRVR